MKVDHKIEEFEELIFIIKIRTVEFKHLFRGAFFVPNMRRRLK